MTRLPAQLAVNGALLGIAAATLFPLVWMVAVSFMTPGEASTYPPPLVPRDPTLSNYRELFAHAGMARYLLNSVLLAVAVTALSLAFNVAAGYAFAKLRFKGRERIFRMMLGALVIPSQVALVPLFLLLKQLGIVNTYGGVIVPAMASIFGIFLVRQYALGIPDDLLDAARIDGASEFRIFRSIVVPALKPIIVTLCVFTLLGTWNDFMWPLIVLSDQHLYTLPVALGEPVAGARCGQRAHDGRICRDDPARAGGVHRPSALLPAGSHGRQRQGVMAHGLRALVRSLLGCSVLLVLACLPLQAQMSVSPATRVLDRFENLESWKATRFERCRCIASSGARSRRSCAASRFRSARNRRLRACIPRTAARLAGELRDHVRSSRRCADQRLPGQARRPNRRERVVVQASELCLPPRVAKGEDQEAPSRLRMGTNQRTHASSCGPHRIRRGRRGGWWRRFDLCQQSLAARTAARTHGMGYANPARVIVRCRRRARLRGRRQHCDGMEERSCYRSRAIPHPRLRRATGVRRPGAALATRHVRIAATTFNSRTTAANGERCAASRRDKATWIRCCCPMRRLATCAWHCTMARRARTPSPKSRFATSRSVPRPMHSSRPLRASSRAVIFHAGFSGQQSYWTIVGVDGGSDSGLLSEDGALEVARGGFSIEPFVRVDSRVVHLGGRRHDAVLARRLSAHSERDMASAALDVKGDGLCLRRSCAVAAVCDIRDAQPHRSTAHTRARSGDTAVAGQSSRAVPQCAERCRPDQRNRVEGSAR